MFMGFGSGKYKKRKNPPVRDGGCPLAGTSWKQLDSTMRTEIGQL